MKRDVNRLECDVSNAETALGKLLIPDDQAAGVPFNVWVGDGILEAVMVRPSTYKVGWRKKPTKAPANRNQGVDLIRPTGL